jgi:hypothetical protein
MEKVGYTVLLGVTTLFVDGIGVCGLSIVR